MARGWKVRHLWALKVQPLSKRTQKYGLLSGFRQKGTKMTSTNLFIKNDFQKLALGFSNHSNHRSTVELMAGLIWYFTLLSHNKCQKVFGWIFLSRDLWKQPGQVNELFYDCFYRYIQNNWTYNVQTIYPEDFLRWRYVSAKGIVNDFQSLRRLQVLFQERYINATNSWEYSLRPY